MSSTFFEVSEESCSMTGFVFDDVSSKP